MGYDDDNVVAMAIPRAAGSVTTRRNENIISLCRLYQIIVKTVIQRVGKLIKKILKIIIVLFNIQRFNVMNIFTFDN